MKKIVEVNNYEKLHLIAEFAQANSYMEFYGFEDDIYSSICFNTRRNHNLLSVTPSEIDIEEANRLGKLMISALLPNAYFVVNTYDEWVTLEIRF